MTQKEVHDLRMFVSGHDRSPESELRCAFVVEKEASRLERQVRSRRERAMMPTRGRYP